MIKAALILLLAAAAPLATLATQGNRARLYKSLFQDYNRNILPEAGAPVRYGLMPIELELTQTGVLQGSIWERFFYKDSRLAWDPEEFGGLEQLRVPAHVLWVPDITLYNRHNTEQAMNPHMTPGYYSNAVLMSTGDVILVPEMEMQATCLDADLNDFWGEQQCTLKFGSWTFHDKLLNVTFYDADNLDLSMYRKNSPARINSYELVREAKKYDCCPEDYVNLQFKLKVQRRYRLTEQGVIWNPLLPKGDEAEEAAAEVEQNDI